MYFLVSYKRIPLPSLPSPPLPSPSFQKGPVSPSVTRNICITRVNQLEQKALADETEIYFNVVSDALILLYLHWNSLVMRKLIRFLYPTLAEDLCDIRLTLSAMSWCFSIFALLHCRFPSAASLIALPHVCLPHFTELIVYLKCIKWSKICWRAR